MESNTTAEWLARLESEGARPREGKLHVQALGALQPDELRRLLSAGSPDLEGWVCQASALWLLDGSGWSFVSGTRGAPPGAEGFDGSLILSGELRRSELESIHLRRHDGRLEAWRYVEGRGEDVVLFDQSFRSTERDRRLRYRVAWARRPERPDDDGLEIPVWRPWIARFLGW